MIRVLIVDEEAAARRTLRSILDGAHSEIIEAGGLAQARKALAEHDVNVVVTAPQMFDGNGLDVLAAARAIDTAIPVIFLANAATVRAAVDAREAGAFDFVTVPFLPEQVRAAVERAAESASLRRENDSLRRQVLRLSPANRLIGLSPAIRHLRRLILRIAPTDATILIGGESGTGKQLVARAVHAASPRADRIFLPVPCEGSSEATLEKELFGHEGGRSDGADPARPGLLEEAHGGTLYLDGACEMSQPLQTRLLRVLVTGEVARIGSEKPRLADVRLILATHRDLEQRVQDPQPREDLYYRLAAIPVRVVPLRERKEDIPELAAHFLGQIARELKTAIPDLSPAALGALARYDFPGNVRELRNVLEHAAILAGARTIDAADLSLSDGASESGQPFEDWIGSLPTVLNLRSLEDSVEKALVLRALSASEGVAAQAARKLGLSRSDLAYKLRRLGISKRRA